MDGGVGLARDPWPWGGWGRIDWKQAIHQFAL